MKKVMLSLLVVAGFASCNKDYNSTPEFFDDLAGPILMDSVLFEDNIDFKLAVGITTFIGIDSANYSIKGLTQFEYTILNKTSGQHHRYDAGSILNHTFSHGDILEIYYSPAYDVYPMISINDSAYSTYSLQFGEGISLIVNK